MDPLLAIVLAIIGLGVLFLAVQRYCGPRMQKVGPWLVVSLAALSVGLGTCLSQESPGDWQQLLQPHAVSRLAWAIGFLALFASEAVLIGRWLLCFSKNPWLSLATFTLGTFLAWLITFLALVEIVPGS